MLSFMSQFKHGREMRESKDEILAGELIRQMARLGFSAVGFRADSGDQKITFKPVKEDALYTIEMTLDRKTGGSKISQAAFGSKAWLTVRAQVKNLVADPDDLLEMYRTDAKNIFKSPMMGHTKLDHQLNSVFATKRITIDIDKFIPPTPEAVEELKKLLVENIDELRKTLLPYKKTTLPEVD